MTTFPAFVPPQRTLMGPGPSDVAPSVLKAMSAPLLGHLDPVFVKMMDEIKAMLRQVFITQNEMTFPVSGTGSAGMEFCCANLIEPGDEVIIGVNGVFGTRMCDVAERCGAKVIKVEAPWGQIIEPKQIAEALRHHRPKFVAIVHAETSTGALTPVEEISKMAHDRGSLMLLDTVTSLGGCPVRLDDWDIDAVYSGTQKCLSCPPGLSPVSLSPRALEVATNKITVNAIAPGYVWTALVARQIPDTMKARNMTEDEVKQNVLLAAQPTKQFVTVEQVAGLAVYLASDAAASITGTTISMDGGWTAQ